MQNAMIKYAKNKSDRRDALANAWVLASDYEQVTHSERTIRPKLSKQDRQELREIDQLERMDTDTFRREQFDDYYRRGGR